MINAMTLATTLPPPTITKACFDESMYLCMSIAFLFMMCFCMVCKQACRHAARKAGRLAGMCAGKLKQAGRQACWCVASMLVCMQARQTDR